MQIKIDNIDNKKEYLDECFEIVTVYDKIVNDPEGKIYKRSTRLLLQLLLLTAWLGFTIVLALVFSGIVFWVCFGIAAIAVLISAFLNISHMLTLNNLTQTTSNSIFELNENEIKIENKNLNSIVSIPTDKLLKVIMSKRCITFIPTEITDDGINHIIIPRTYEKEVIQSLDELNKNDLIVYSK